MKDQKFFDYLKLRASWGRLGNDHVAASDGLLQLPQVILHPVYLETLLSQAIKIQLISVI